MKNYREFIKEEYDYGQGWTSSSTSNNHISNGVPTPSEPNVSSELSFHEIIEGIKNRSLKIIGAKYKHPYIFHEYQKYTLYISPDMVVDLVTMGDDGNKVIINGKEIMYDQFDNLSEEDTNDLQYFMFQVDKRENPNRFDD